MTSSSAALIGFFVGAGVPVAYGVFLLQAHYTHVASLPPGSAACGMPAVGGFALILFGGPIVGLMGMVVGAVLNWTWHLIRHGIFGGFSID